MKIKLKPWIYRSTDYGKKWDTQQIRGASYSNGVLWTRDIIHMGNGVLYINFPGHENIPEFECAMFLKGTDYGKTWNITNDIVGRNNEKINAIYRSVEDIDGSIIA